MSRRHPRLYDWDPCPFHLSRADWRLSNGAININLSDDFRYARRYVFEREGPRGTTDRNHSNRGRLHFSHLIIRSRKLEALGVGRRVGIITLDFRLYARLVQQFREIIKFETLIPGQSLPSTDRYILLTSPNEFTKIQSQYPDQLAYAIDATSDAVFEEQLRTALNKGRKPFNCLIIGIDPGETVGIAVIADGMILFAEEYHPPFQETLVEAIRRLLASFQALEKIIRVGLSPAYQVTNLLRLLLPFYGFNIRIELVDERKTSTRPSKTNSDAAMEIARRSGRPIGVVEATHQLNDYVIPEGRIQEIKK